MGIYAATRPYSLFDKIANTVAFMGFSLPTFFTGLLLILLFSIKLDWLPFVFRADLQVTGWQWWWEKLQASHHADHRAGPFPGRQLDALCAFSAVLDVVKLDYVVTARSKGLAERVVIMKHVVRNALIPVVTLVALTMPQVFRRRHRHRADLPHPGHRQPADRRHSAQRHAGHHGRDLRVQLPGDHLQPDRRPAVRLARSAYLFSIENC